MKRKTRKLAALTTTLLLLTILLGGCTTDKLVEALYPRDIWGPVSTLSHGNLADAVWSDNSFRPLEEMSWGMEPGRVTEIVVDMALVPDGADMLAQGPDMRDPGRISKNSSGTSALSPILAVRFADVDAVFKVSYEFDAEDKLYLVDYGRLFDLSEKQECQDLMVQIARRIFAVNSVSSQGGEEEVVARLQTIALEEGERLDIAWYGADGKTTFELWGRSFRDQYSVAILVGAEEFVRIRKEILEGI